MSFFYSFPIFLTLVNYCLTETLPNCDSKETCSECIQELGCVWCINPKNISNQYSHCFPENSLFSSLCPENLIRKPKFSFQILEDQKLTSVDEKAIQIRPQKVKLKLRKNERFVLNFQYAQAENYPVDLYYIMDLSASMEEHREKLAKLGDKLAKTMINITNNFRLGFGSFVDKVELPFVSTVPAKLASPCTINKIGRDKIFCSPPYSFKNHMSLTHDYKMFSHEVAQSKISGNLDAPEGGFDALMQAMVCKKQIGWRDKARHLLVFSTDGEFHIAGDGKLAGVIEPNDGKCHMENDSYTDFLIYDYPSVSHINYIAKENNINIIFAIVKKIGVLENYRFLSEKIENSNTGALDGKSENVVNLVLDNYNKIVDSITIKANATNDVDVKISSNCPHPKENGCTNIHVGEVVNFTAVITPLECSQTPKIISIKPEALDESILIELETICSCDCETESNENYKANAKECTEFGNLECGVCNCLPGRFGKNCECDRSTSVSEDVTNCKDNDEICSGLGTCKCGKCECNKRTNPSEKIYGKFCQCDNYSCKRDAGLLCSDNGNCDCGECKCHAGWTGDACQCPESNSTCIQPGGDGSVCNRHGQCNCGKCECFMDNYRYSGKYCEECPSCPGQRCNELKDCVECQTYSTGIYDKNQCQVKCTSFLVNKVDKIQENPEENKKICRVPDQISCTFAFEYYYNRNNELIVNAERTKMCSAIPNIWAWIFGVIASILVVGLISLITWKISTTILDRREYAKFENERRNLKWHRNDNPLYKQATSTFSNPVYKRNSFRFSQKNKSSQ